MANELARYSPGSGTFRKLMSKYASAETRLKSLRQKSEGVVEHVIRTTEVQAAAFGFGAMQGAFYDPQTDKNAAELAGIPVEILAGVGLHTASILGLGGKHSDHLRNFGDGAIAAYVSNLGRGWGYKFAKERKDKGGPSIKGIRDEVASLID